MADTQTEKAYQSQEGINSYNKYLLYGVEPPRRKVTLRKNNVTTKKLSRKMNATRYFKNVGLGFTIPSDAVHLNYVDKKCPFTGNVSISGRILRAMVISTKMQRTIIVRRDYLHFIRKYNRYEKRHRNISAHCSPAFRRIKEGDIVTIGQCRPISKTVRFNVLKVQPSKSATSVKKQFILF